VQRPRLRSRRRPVQPGPDPGRRFVAAHLEHATGRVEHAPHYRGGHCPTIGAAVIVWPGGHLSVAPAEPSRWNSYPDAQGERPLGRRDHPARIARRLVFLIRSSNTAMPACSCPAAWACARVPLCSGHVWPRPPLLRCERDQAGLLDPAHRPTPNLAPSWNAAPTDPLPVVRYDARTGRSLDLAPWGLVPYWAKDGDRELVALCYLVS
jgi:hypothetical protein